MSITSIGSSGLLGSYGGAGAVSNSPAAATSPRDEFDKFQAMTPAQKMRAMMLAKLGLTEEQVKAMTPEERKKVEDKLKDMIKQSVHNDPTRKNSTGVLADVTA
jgi:hypothetical protein